MYMYALSFIITENCCPYKKTFTGSDRFLLRSMWPMDNADFTYVHLYYTILPHKKTHRK